MTVESPHADERDEIVAAALAFVASTSVFRQPKECRDQFVRLAVAALKESK